jgi:hypothetical protein
MQKVVGSSLGWWLLFVLLVFGLLIFGLYWWTFGGLSFVQDPNAWGSFGSYVGGVLGPVVATFTLVVALEVLRLQRKELADTSAALQSQAAIAERNLRAQRFMDLMNIYKGMLETSFQEMQGGHGVAGKRALEMWFRNAGGPHLFNFSRPGHTNRATIAEAKKSWELHEVSTSIQQYFRVVFGLLRDAEHLLGPDRQLFVRIFRAQLSRTELSLLAMNLYFGGQGAAMIPLAAEYRLLKHLPEGLLRDEVLQSVGSEVFGRKYVATNEADVAQS